MARALIAARPARGNRRRAGADLPLPPACTGRCDRIRALAGMGAVAPLRLTGCARPGRPGDESGSYTKFRLNIGRKDNADPRRILPMLCRRGELTRTEIGSIKIFDTETTVEIAQPCRGALCRAGAQEGCRQYRHHAFHRRPGRVNTPRSRDDDFKPRHRDGGKPFERSRVVTNLMRAKPHEGKPKFAGKFKDGGKPKSGNGPKSGGKPFKKKFKD